MLLCLHKAGTKRFTPHCWKNVWFAVLAQGVSTAFFVLQALATIYNTGTVVNTLYYISEDTTYFDISLSKSYSYVLGVGYHFEVSLSLFGIACDLYEYFAD